MFVLTAIALVGEPALLLVLFAGHPWQMDMHMYFFAMIALNIAWFDRSALIIASRPMRNAGSTTIIVASPAAR